MKLMSFLIPVVLITVVSCNKTNSGSKPQISIVSVNTTVVRGGQMDVRLKFTSKSANLSGGSFTSIRTRLNQRPPTNISGRDTLPNTIPSFPNQTQGELEYVLPYVGYLTATAHENDTLVFKFFAIDAAGHSSDTISSPKIIIINP